MNTPSSLSVDQPEKWSSRNRCRLWKSPSPVSDNTSHVTGKQKKDEIDSHIAHALSQLTMAERDQVYLEVHGVEEETEESPEMIDDRLDRLEQELRRMKSEHPKGEAFRLAEQTNPRYVNDYYLRLKFLRCESFRVSRAADRMIRFFDIKLYLFGRDLICRDITMEDLSKDDLETLRAGFIQNLPVRDRSGRAIIILMPNFQKYVAAENMTRVLWFMMMCLLDDEETQKRGVSGIIYNVGDFVSGVTDMKTVSQGTWVQATVPIKTCSLHHCFNDSAFRLIVDFSMKFFGDEAKARAKMHHGTHMECVYNLMTFGIPPDALPVTMDGQLKRRNHMNWIKMRKQQEEALAATPNGHGDHTILGKCSPLSIVPQKTPKVVLPSRSDVLFGRGKPFREHIGNMRLYILLDENLIRYESLKMKEKSGLIAEMVESIKAQGGRFLKQNGLLWEEVNDKQAREKVSHAFRTRLRIVLAEAQMNDSATRNTETTNSRLKAPNVETVISSTSLSNSKVSLLNTPQIALNENYGGLSKNNDGGQKSVIGCSCLPDSAPRSVSLESSAPNSPPSRPREEPCESPASLGLEEDLAEFSQNSKRART